MNKTDEVSPIWALVMLVLIGYALYSGYSKQRTKYEDNIAMRIQGACSAFIENDFAQHASTFDIEETKEDVFIGKKSEFNIFNELLSLSIEGRSVIYFPGYAPQEITCRGTILNYDVNNALTEETVVSFVLYLPKYLPPEYNGYLKSHDNFELTMKQIERLSPIVTLFPLAKPKFSIFGFSSVGQFKQWLFN